MPSIVLFRYISNTENKLRCLWGPHYDNEEVLSKASTADFPVVRVY